MRAPNRIVGVVIGAGFVLLGIAGFVLPPGGVLLWLLQVNPAQNIAHLALGAVLVAAALVGQRASRRTNAIVGAVFLVLGIAGLFLVGSEGNVLALNSADNALHFAASVVLLAVGLGADRPRAS
jgi:hypothetical protein